MRYTKFPNFQFILTDSRESLYYRGRDFTKEIYKNQFKTDISKMSDDYDFCLVGLYKNEVIANFTLSLYRNKKELPSEKFLKNLTLSEDVKELTFEITGTAINSKTSYEHKQYILFAACLFLFEFVEEYNLQYLLTIQHNYLIKRIEYFAPFFNHLADSEFDLTKLPNDKYWQGMKSLPKVYHGDFLNDVGKNYFDKTSVVLSLI